MLDFKPLDHYFQYIMSQPFCNLAPLYFGVNQYGPMPGLVLHRQDQFQVELFIVPKEVQLVEFHNHPNVDSYEMHLSGDFIFESNGVQYHTSESCTKLTGKELVWVPSEHIHGGLFKTPGAFLSFQYWKNGVQPTSVGNDFIVDHNNPSHLKGLKGLDREDKPVILTSTK